MKSTINKEFLTIKDELHTIVNSFDSNNGVLLSDGKRNKIKTFELINNDIINIKSFKVPNIFNKIAYNFLRKSKAQRSFEYANKLNDLGIGTPKSIAYYEQKSLFFFKKSYYVSEQIECDFTFRHLTTNFDHPDYQQIIRAFTRFTYLLHTKNVHFLDHSPGNTLIKKNNGDYNFYLVDLNRMKFEPLSFQKRIQNFSRLTYNRSIIKIMSDEYAKCINEDFETVYNLMVDEADNFFRKLKNKKEFKKKVKFWKS